MISIDSSVSYPKELTEYFTKIRQVYNSSFKNKKYGNYYNKIIFKIKEIGFKKFKETEDLDKAREFLEACSLFSEIELAFSGYYNISNRLECLQQKCTCPIEGVLIRLVEILEEPEVFSIFFEIDNMTTEIERKTEQFNRVIQILRETDKEHSVVDITQEIENFIYLIQQEQRDE